MNKTNDPLREALKLVEEQANDEGLWFHAATAPENYLQIALRELHAKVEALSQPADAAHGWKLVPEWKLRRAAEILERDGDEHGVGADLRAMLAASPAAPQPDELMAQREELPPLPEPQWIVNDLGELGVRVGDRFFFLYKGDNIEYGVDGIGEAENGIAIHEDGKPMKYRMVGKREFGETCWPLKWIIAGRSQDRYTEELVYTQGLSFGKPEDGAWRDLPARAAIAKVRGGSAL